MADWLLGVFPGQRKDIPGGGLAVAHPTIRAAAPVALPHVENLETKGPYASAEVR